MNATMTTEELKEWRIKVATDIANGAKYQMKGGVGGLIDWTDVSSAAVMAEVFCNPSERLFEVRIKPEPRKVWIGWPITGKHGWKDHWIRPGELSPSDLDNDHTWQLVTEERK